MSNTSVYDMPLPMDTEFYMFFLPHRRELQTARKGVDRKEAWP